jgi:VanZ family protein
LTSSGKRILKVWLPSVIWLAVIVVESTNWGSAENTGRLLYPIFHFLFGTTMAAFATLHMFLRKTGHVIGYSILSVLLFRSWRATFPRLSTRWCLQWASLAVLCTALVASMDEWHQSYLPSRTGAFHDVILDTSAAIAMQIAVFVFLGSRARRSEQPIPQ